ncbi:MAG: type II secretion system F family protein [Candidatus Rokubacteria bacterium]|nr:type II secretion system F family protein [Candidatus Rokubacteria bacterium]
MPVFTYRATDRVGRMIDGTMEAASRRAVVERLHREEYYPVAVESAEIRAGWRQLVPELPFQRVTSKDLLALTRELATLVDAGLPLDRALQILGELTGHPRLQRIVQDLTRSVRGGNSLAEALARHHPRPFSRLYINMVRAGEKGGVLEIALKRLTGFLEAAQELREAIVSALIYPTLLAVVGSGAVVFLLTFVLPRFAVIFADLGQALPLPTRILLAVSEGIQTYWWGLLLLGLLTLLGWRAATGTEAGRLAWDRWLLGTPLLGGLLLRLEVARFARTLGTLLQAGVPVLQALAVVKEVAVNRVVVEALERLHEGIKRGGGIASPLAASRVFPSLAVHMVRVGEETGRLEEMLSKVADVYEGEVRTAVKRLIAVLEPAIILTLGVVVLLIVVAILLAIFGINELPL